MKSLSPIIPVVLFVVVFPLFWCGVVFLTAYLGGWLRLAKQYRYEGPWPERRWSLQSARIGWGNYNGILTVGANWEGLYLKPMLLFRCGHPPLFIPWYDLSVKQSGTLFKAVELRFQRVPSVRIRLSRKLGQRLADVAGDGWPDRSDVPAEP